MKKVIINLIGWDFCANCESRSENFDRFYGTVVAKLPEDNKDNKKEEIKKIQINYSRADKSPIQQLKEKIISLGGVILEEEIIDLYED
jgi:hypothetical protein